MPREKSNPYSSRGLEDFNRLNTELAAKREYISRKKGVPGEAVRFAYRNQRWVPILMKNSSTNDGHTKDSTMQLAAPVESTLALAAPVDSTLATAAPVVETKAIRETKFETNECVELENIHGAIGMIITLVCMTYGGKLCAVLWACACCWWGLLFMFRKGKNSCFHDNKTRIRLTIDVISKGEKVNMD